MQVDAVDGEDAALELANQARHLDASIVAHTSQYGVDT